MLILQHLGYVAIDGKLFWLTPRVLRLGHSYLASARLARTVQPFLQRVAAGTQESAYVSVLDGDELSIQGRGDTAARPLRRDGGRPERDHAHGV